MLKVSIFGVGYVGLHETEIRECLELLKASPLQLRVIVIVEVIYPDHDIAALEQCCRDMHAYEPGCARNQDLH